MSAPRPVCFQVFARAVENRTKRVAEVAAAVQTNPRVRFAGDVILRLAERTFDALAAAASRQLDQWQPEALHPPSSPSESAQPAQLMAAASSDDLSMDTPALKASSLKRGSGESSTAALAAEALEAPVAAAAAPAVDSGGLSMSMAATAKASSLKKR